jgi:membrane-bound lytic murein transglycosylase F
MLNLYKIIGLAISFLIVNACQEFSFQGSEKIEEIRVGYVKGPFSWQSNSEGLEKDLVGHFARENQSRIKWIEFKSEKVLLDELVKENIDLGFSRFPEDLLRKMRISVGAVYDESELQLTCFAESSKKSNSRSTTEKLIVPWKVASIISSQQQEKAKEKVPAKSLTLSIEDKGSTFDILQSLQKNKSNCALLDAREIDHFLRLFPEFFESEEPIKKISYAIGVAQGRQDLRTKMALWFQQASRKREILRSKDRYLGHLQALTLQDKKKFFRSFEQDLGELKPFFKRSAQDFDLPWQLVAAVAFQESHWNNEAESFTGVRGIMQITTQTASHLGLENREDLEQSIWGGAKYLRSLIDQQPPQLHSRDRLALALATYNVGIGHLKDAQDIATQMGRDPNSWAELKQILPLLSQPTYYQKTRFGKARGHEPVDFTLRVLAYFDLLNAKSVSRLRDITLQ